MFKEKVLAEEIEKLDTDVVHFHNISLIGGPGVLKMGRKAVRIMTAARALADLPDAPALEVRPEAVRLGAVHPLFAGGKAPAAVLAIYGSDRARFG